MSGAVTIAYRPAAATRTESTYGNLALVAMMPISFALVVLAIVALQG